MIADGQTVDISALTRLYLERPLTADMLESGRVITHNADTPIADSAPAATAMATGYKSSTRFIGTLPNAATLPGAFLPKEAKRPIANIMEAARLAGKSIGIIATSEVMHATPAAFSAHYPERNSYDNLSEQQVYQHLDVLFGGGYKFFTPEGRKDGQDLVSEFKRLGYQIVTNKSEMNQITSGKVWGAFAPADMVHELDRLSEKPEQPSLEEMVEKAIEILAKNPKGFVLMVEGSKIDWAAHANDVIGMISDSISYDNALAKALIFAQTNNDTLLLATSDHGTGGLRVDGRRDSGYDLILKQEILTPLKKATRTGESISRMIVSGSNITEVLAKYYGIDDPTPTEIASISGKSMYDTYYSIGALMAKRAKLTFTTHGHTSEDVPLYSYLPNNKRLMAGVIDNTDYARYAAASLGLDLDKTSDRLFMSSKELQQEVSNIIITTNNSQITFSKDNTIVTLIKNKNLAIINGTQRTLEGVVVYNEVDWYFPKEIVNLFN